MTHEDGVDLASIDGNKLTYTVLFSRLRFAYARAAFTYGGVACIDLTFAALRKFAPPTAKVGAYMILGWHGATPEQQVAKLVEAVGARKPGELAVALDLEADSAKALGMTPAQCLAWAERGLDALYAAGYRVVVVYTSARVWIEVFGDLPSAKFAATTCWAKIPYVVDVRQPARWDLIPTTVADHHVPRPWRDPASPGVRILQGQGDAIGVDGASSTVDLDRFIPLQLGDRGNGVEWLQTELGVAADGDFGPITAKALADRQAQIGIAVTGVMDLATYQAIAWDRAA